MQVEEKYYMEEIGMEYLDSYIKNKCQECQYVRLIYCNKLNEIEKALEENEYDFIGFGTYDKNIIFIISLLYSIKARHPNLRIILGGYGASVHYTEIMDNYRLVDHIIIGEGEIPLSWLLKGVDYPNIPRLTYRTNDGWELGKGKVFVEDLNELPYPEHNIMRYSDSKVINISTTRGCYGNCSFCLSPSFWNNRLNKRWRARSIESIINEISFLCNGTYKQFNFIDNSFEDNPSVEKRTLNLAQSIIDHEIKIKYYVSMRSTCYKTFSDADMELLVQSGLTCVFLGVESFNDTELKLYNKGLTLIDNMNCIEFLMKHEVNIDIGFINLNPYSTIETLKKNAMYLHKYQFSSLYHYFSKLMIFRGTTIYAKIEKDGLLKNGNSYNNMYGYDFVNSEIQRINDRILIIQKQNDIRDISSKSEYYTHYFKNIFQCSLYYFEKTKNWKMIELIKVCKSIYKSLIKELNDYIYYIFLLVIKNKEVEMQINVNLAIQCIENLDILRNDMITNMYKEDSDVHKFI